MSVEETLKRIEKKLGKIETELEEIRKQILEPELIGPKSLVELPDHLRKTAMGLMRIGQGTASDVSRRTGRARAVESGYLNQLERQGFVTSFRRSRQKFFSIDSELMARPRIQDV